jgi:hypothetical protein
MLPASNKERRKTKRGERLADPCLGLLRNSSKCDINVKGFFKVIMLRNKPGVERRYF